MSHAAVPEPQPLGERPGGESALDKSVDGARVAKRIIDVVFGKQGFAGVAATLTHAMHWAYGTGCERGTEASSHGSACAACWSAPVSRSALAEVSCKLGADPA